MKKQNVQSKLVSLILTFPFLSYVVIAAPSRTPVEQAAVDIYTTHLKEELPVFDEVTKLAAIEILREVAASKRSRIGRGVVGARGAQIALLRLGDEPSIEEAIAQFRGYNSRFAWAGLPKAMEWSHQPKLIPYLAEDFFRDEDPTEIIRSKRNEGPSESTIIVPPRSVYAGTIVMRIIKREPAFSEELKKWADEMINMRINDVFKFRETSKQWWEANKDNFETENYGKVKPFVLTALEKKLLKPKAVPKPKISPSASASESTFAKKPSPPGKKAVEPVKVEPTPDNPFPYWIFIIGGVVVVGLVVILKRK